jgi:hypothetical protein
MREAINMWVLFRIACADPVGVRHALSVVAELATKDLTAVAMAVGKCFYHGCQRDTLIERCD